MKTIKCFAKMATADVTSHSLLTSGMDKLLALNKEIEAEEVDQAFQQTKVIRLRFTRRQYQSFRDACTILELVSSDPGFPDFVKKALGADIKVATIAKQFVNPILEAPMRIPVKIPRAKSANPEKESYFTAPIDVTDKCMQLYKKVANHVQLRYDVSQGKTCVTDVRVMVSKYFAVFNLKNDQGTTLDNFIYKLTPDAINSSKDVLYRVGNKYVIPRGDRKVVTGIINEIAFGPVETS